MPDTQWFSLDSQQSPVYLRNLELFRAREPAQANRVESSVSRLCEYEFFWVGKEQYVCRERTQAEPFYNPAEFHSQLKNRFSQAMSQFQNGRELAAITGSCLGFLAALVGQAIRGNYKQGAVLFENRPELIAAQFCLYDCQQLIQSNQIFWAIGDPIHEILESVWKKYRLDLVPANKIFPVQERWLTDCEKQEIQHIGGWVNQRWNETQTRLSLLKPQFLERMSQKSNLQNGKIWAMSSLNAYAHNPLIHSLLSGFEQVGLQTHLLYLQDGFGDTYRLTESLMDTSPDLILLCNTASQSFFSSNIHRPYIDWFLDHPRYYAGDSFKQNLSPNDFVFYIDREYGKELEGTKAGRRQFLPACASILRKGERRENLSAPILFVGAYRDATPFYQILSPPSLEEIERLLDYMIQNPKIIGSEAIATLNVSERSLNPIRWNARDNAERVKERLPDEARQIDYFLYSLANNRKRETIIRHLLDLGIVIYGPDSWLNVLGEQHASQYRGWISADDLADAYASADVVLNIHSLQCPTCLNPRDFDVLAAGGCLLADWVEDMDAEIIEPGRDCIAIRNIQEYPEAVTRLLGDPDARESLREQGHSTYLSRHTPRHRAEAILNAVRESQ